MERLWSPAVATSGNRWQMREPRKRLEQAKTAATGCDQLPIGAHGKEGVDGSSPSEGFDKMPANGHFVVVCPNNTRVGGGHIPGTRDALRSRATSGGTVHQMSVDEFVDEVPANRPQRCLDGRERDPPPSREEVMRAAWPRSRTPVTRPDVTAGTRNSPSRLRFRPLSQLTVRFRVELRRSVRDEGWQGVRRLCGAPAPSGWLGRMRSR